MKFKYMAAATAMLALAGVAHGQAIITNGTIKLGVNALGALNVGGGVVSAQGSTTTVGLRLLTGGLEYESTSDGCTCEGWGAGIASGVGAGATGYNNTWSGSAGLTFVSATAYGAGTSYKVVSTIGGMLKVTHDYHPSTSTNLYQVDVTIENITGGTLGDAVTGIVYRRVMDWDIEPTAFSERVNLKGWPATNLWRTSDDGFRSANVLSSSGGSICAGAGPNADFSDSGPCDHGALFDFKFGALAAGASISFKTFYGAATTEAVLLSAMSAQGVAVYSDAACSSGFAVGACPAIHGFGFAGVGGTVIPDPIVPEPSTWLLTGTGLLGVIATARRRRA